MTAFRHHPSTALTLSVCSVSMMWSTRTKLTTPALLATSTGISQIRQNSMSQVGVCHTTCIHFAKLILLYHKHFCSLLYGNSMILCLVLLFVFSKGDIWLSYCLVSDFLIDNTGKL